MRKLGQDGESAREDTMQGKWVSGAVIAAMAAFTGQAGAQERVFDKPYYIDKPVIEAIGRAWIEEPANRASFSVSFVEQGRDVDNVSARAVDRARLAVQALRSKASPAAARVQSNLSVQALYEQYRDADGNKRDNEREDKVSSYVARTTLTITMLDLSKLGEARAAVLALKPEEAGAVNFELVPTSELQRKVYQAAVEDGAKRAKASALAAGTVLGPLLAVQEGQGPCLGQWRYDYGRSGESADRAVAYAAAPPPAEIVVTAGRIGGKEVQITEQDIARFTLPSDPPISRLDSFVCLVYRAG